jgi:DNA mismatch repair protein MSH2
LKIVEYFFANEQVRVEMQQMYLRTFPDLEKLYSKFYRVQAKMRNNAQLLDCVKVYNMIHTLESLVQHLDDNCIDEEADLRVHIIEPLKGVCDEFKKLKEMLEECIDIAKAKQNDYVINPNFCPDLQELDKQIEGVKSKMEELRTQVCDDLALNQPLKLVESNLHTYLFECLKQEGDNGMRKSKQNYKIIGIKNRIMSFTCPGLKDLCRQFTDLEEQYKIQQLELVGKVLDIASTYYPLLESVSMLVSKLDVLAAFAQVSSQ